MTEQELQAIDVEIGTGVGFEAGNSLTEHEARVMREVVPRVVAEVRRLQGLLDAGGYKTAMLTMQDRALKAEQALAAVLREGERLGGLIKQAEWFDDSDNGETCPWCRGGVPYTWEGEAFGGHKATCPAFPPVGQSNGDPAILQREGVDRSGHL